MATGQERTGDTYDFDKMIDNKKLIKTFEDKLRLGLLTYFIEGKVSSELEKTLFLGDKRSDELVSTHKNLATTLEKAQIIEIDMVETNLNVDPNNLVFFKTQFEELVKRFIENKIPRGSKWLRDAKGTEFWYSKLKNYPFQSMKIRPGDSKRKPFQYGFRKGMTDDVKKLPTLIVCVVGGISHNEIVGINALKEEGGVNFIVGGTNIYTSVSIIKDITHIRRYTSTLLIILSHLVQPRSPDRNWPFNQHTFLYIA